MEWSFTGCRLAFNPRYVQAPEQEGLFRHVAPLVTLMIVTTATAEIIFPSLPYKARPTRGQALRREQRKGSVPMLNSSVPTSLRVGRE